MMENMLDNNNLFDESDESEEYEFKNNFVNTPWDDRSTKSKFGIVALLITIFVATMACVINSFVMHYSTTTGTKLGNVSEIICQMVKFDDYQFAARIHSVSTQEVICVGALVSNNSVLANGACMKSGPTRLRLGSLTDPRCKKGFSFDIVEIFHDGVLGKKLVLLSSYEKMAECAKVISIDQNLEMNSQAYTIGRAAHGRLSRQPVRVSAKNCTCSGILVKNLNNRKNIICVKSLARCPVLAGDLLVQNGRLFGLASTSDRSHEDSLACFADLKLIYRELKELEVEVPKPLIV